MTTWIGARIQLDLEFPWTKFMTVDQKDLWDRETFLVLSIPVKRFAHIRSKFTGSWISLGERLFFVGLRERTGEIAVWDFPTEEWLEIP